jgi:capsular polysaccharide biosynthesis protein
MELKEYLQIFKRNIKLFVTIVIGVFLLGILIQVGLPSFYKAEVNLDVTRTGQQKETADYRYDEFYRLQADERFADTVVRWLQSGRIQEDILSLAAPGVEFKRLKASRLSSQLIRVTFIVKEESDARIITAAISKVLNEKSQELNKYQQNNNWFKLIVSEPVVNSYKIPLFKLSIILLFVGIFAGFWGVLIRHYL